jgi:hypothetical protein
MEKNMMLYTSATAGQKTFALMPINDNCPFNEAIYMPHLEALAVLSKTTRDTFTMLERLDETGETSTSIIKTEEGKKAVKKQHRVQVASPWEYFIHEKNEIEEFIKLHAVNADTFDYIQYTTQIEVVEQPSIIIQ